LRYTQKVNHKKVLLHKPKNVCSKLSGACQVYCCFELACDVTDFEAYREMRHTANVLETYLQQASIDVFKYMSSSQLTTTTLYSSNPCLWPSCGTAWRERFYL
jgi:hypothetical protein